MAYDPEARSQSNSAMIIGVVALVLLVGGAIAYMSTRSSTPDTVAVTTTPAERTVVVNQPAPNPAAPVVIEKTSPVVVTQPVTKTVETHTTVTRDHVVAPPSAASAPPARTETNVTVNMPKTETATEPNKTTLQPQAGTNSSEPAPATLIRNGPI